MSEGVRRDALGRSASRRHVHQGEEVAAAVVADMLAELRARPDRMWHAASVYRMDAPTATLIRAWSPPLFIWADYGFPVADPDTALEVRVGWAVGELYAVTGRTLASITAAEEVSVAQKVLAAFVMMEAVGGGQAAIEVMNQPWLKQMVAGSYSETRFSPAEMAGGGTGKSPPFPNWLWWMIWSLCTDEARDRWRRLLGECVAPAVAFVPVSFDATCDWEPGY